LTQNPTLQQQAWSLLILPFLKQQQGQHSNPNVQAIVMLPRVLPAHSSVKQHTCHAVLCCIVSWP
jgi:hypothetical protein